MISLPDPQSLHTVKGLLFAAKTMADSFLNGVHKSYSISAGVEFSQYRSYEAGDDLRRLDWKMFARSDRYYIREAEIESAFTVKFVIDGSGSMNHRDGAWKKIDYAKYLAAALGYLAQQQGDRIGLYVLNEASLFALSPHTSRQHMLRFFYALESLQAGGTLAGPVHYRQLFGTAKKRELLVLITDYYQHGAEIETLLKELSVSKHEIIVFHLMANNELQLDYGNYTALKDLETGQTISFDQRIKKDYTEKLNFFLTDLRTKMTDRGIAYQLINMQHTPGDALRSFLLHRNRVKR